MDGETLLFKAKSVSLTLKSLTILNVTFTGSDVKNYTFTVDGASFKRVKSGSNVVIKIQNIAAKDLDKEYTITATNGDESYTIRVRALTYAYQVLKKGDASQESLSDLVKALAEYNAAANAYFPE